MSFKRFLHRHRTFWRITRRELRTRTQHLMQHWWARALAVVLGLVLVACLGLWGVSRWYVAQTRDEPLRVGVTFIADYAQYLGLEPRETLNAIFNDLEVKHVRLVSYWNKHEVAPGVYDFTDLDWQFHRAEAAGAKVSLAIGLRQPRWPECHRPAWLESAGPVDWQPQLDAYMTEVIERYRSSPALETYQLENEYNLDAFGECPPPSQERLLSEFNLVKQLDPHHPIIISRSDNLPALLLSEPQPDIVGMSVYRRVWNTNIYQGYFNYPLPSWYYAGLAGLQKIFTGRDSVLHEMQMEPWPPHGKSIVETSQEEQDKSMSADDFAARVRFAEQTGLRTIDLWGAEWWYYRKAVLGDQSVWDAAQRTLRHGLQ